jgi:hypothetical protein
MAYSTSAEERLAAVRQAIQECLTAQSYTIRSRGKTMASLRELRAMEKDLMQEVQDANNGGAMCSVGRMVEPS